MKMQWVKQIFNNLESIKTRYKVNLPNMSEMKPKPRHEALKPLGWLEGTWKTEAPGKGKFPTIKPFEYSEEISFTSVGQPILNYKSQTWNPESKAPMHFEVGFLKIVPNTNKLNFLLAHNFGVTTIEEGQVCDKEIILNSTSIERPTAGSKPPKVLKTKREIRLLSDDCLENVFYMATETNTELTEHLRTVYHRQKDC
ncbi:THAP domain-containing protein 4-like isoform X2 [Belonocnema kinseyi]|uniref:THAP domain-containing protein 4-like isoform X2 n=1 Tax=Belonocnema kinseyi TaxID=2817044 RepID=UPI00143D1AB5|nr:THAP domain-containing protein 4-like isoform X2 [Belonocnema kinseyi]